MRAVRDSPQRAAAYISVRFGFYGCARLPLLVHRADSIVNKDVTSAYGSMAGITLNTNIASLQTQRRLVQSTSGLQQTYARLSSGLRVKSAADDSAGLAVASLLSVDSRILQQGVKNINDGISALDMAEGALNELQHLTERQLELAQQASNGILGSTQRKSLSKEAEILGREYNRIVSQVAFNERRLFVDGGSVLSVQAGQGAAAGIALSLGYGLEQTAGTGSFAAQVPTGPVGVGVTTITADLNNDGKLDFAQSGFNSAGFCLGNGDGTFQSYVAVAPSNYAIGAQDLNADGNLDLVTGEFYRLGVRLGNGNGTFKAAASYGTGGRTQSFDFADFNNDSIPDISTTEIDTGTVTVLFGNGDGSFRAGLSTVVSSSARGITAGDLNGDGKADIIVGSNYAGPLSVLFGNGDGRFSSPNVYNFGQPWKPHLYDLDRDGAVDILVADLSAGTVRVLLGNADGTFRYGATMQSGTQTREAVAADFNRDGFLDIAALNSGDSTAALFFGNGDGTFSSGIRTVIAGSGFESVAAGDFNRDGVPDIAVNQRVLISETGIVAYAAIPTMLTAGQARQAFQEFEKTCERLSTELGSIGALQSRLGAELSTVHTRVENYNAAAAQIMDADVGRETADLLKSQILQQSGAAVLAQANQSSSLALKLLGGLR